MDSSGERVLHLGKFLCSMVKKMISVDITGKIYISNVCLPFCSEHDPWSVRLDRHPVGELHPGRRPSHVSSLSCVCAPQSRQRRR